MLLLVLATLTSIGCCGAPPRISSLTNLPLTGLLEGMPPELREEIKRRRAAWKVEPVPGVSQVPTEDLLLLLDQLDQYWTFVRYLRTYLEPADPESTGGAR